MLRKRRIPTLPRIDQASAKGFSLTVTAYRCKEVRALVLIRPRVVAADEMVAHKEATKLPL